MEVKERIIDLRQYFIYLWENIAVIILFVLICSGMMVGYSYKKQSVAMSTSSSGKKAIIEAVIKQNHDAFYASDNSNKSFTDAEPPAGTYNSSARLFVDFNFDSIEGNANYDLTLFGEKVQMDATLLLVSDDALNSVIDRLDLDQYDELEGITADELKWMINKNFLGANILQVVVTDVDANRAKLITEAVVEEFIEKSEDFDTIDSVKIIDNASTPKGDESGVGIQNSINKKSLMKYGIVGFVASIVLICVFYLILFIFKDAVRNSIDVAFANVSVFGIISKKGDKREEDIKRLAYNISLLKDVKKVTIIPADRLSENEEIIDEIRNKIKEVNKDILLETVSNIKENADATMSAVDSDAVIIFVRYGKTRMKDFLFAKGEMDRIGKDIEGAVIMH